MVYQKPRIGTEWTAYSPNTTRRRLRRVLYSTGNTTPPPQQHLLYPTTIHHTTNVCFTVTTSHYKFPEEQPLASPDLWIHTTVPEAFQNAHPLYQHLLKYSPYGQRMSGHSTRTVPRLLGGLLRWCLCQENSYKQPCSGFC
jgi:hypothetical protein